MSSNINNNILPTQNSLESLHISDQQPPSSPLKSSQFIPTDHIDNIDNNNNQMPQDDLPPSMYNMQRSNSWTHDGALASTATNHNMDQRRHSAIPASGKPAETSFWKHNGKVLI